MEKEAWHETWRHTQEACVTLAGALAEFAGMEMLYPEARDALVLLIQARRLLEDGGA